MNEPQRITLRTVADFVALPPEKIGACLIDFAQWLEVVQAAQLIQQAGQIKMVTPTDAFVWVDDGKHEFTLTLNDREGNVKASITHQFATPEQD